MEHGSTPRPLVQKKTWRDSLPIDMLLSAVSVLVVAQSSSEIPEGLMNNPVLVCRISRLVELRHSVRKWHDSIMVYMPAVFKIVVSIGKQNEKCIPNI